MKPEGVDIKHTCPRRMGEFGPWEREQNLDSRTFRPPTILHEASA